MPRKDNESFIEKQRKQLAEIKTNGEKDQEIKRTNTFFEGGMNVSSSKRIKTDFNVVPKEKIKKKQTEKRNLNDIEDYSLKNKFTELKDAEELDMERIDELQEELYGPKVKNFLEEKKELSVEEQEEAHVNELTKLAELNLQCDNFVHKRYRRLPGELYSPKKLYSYCRRWSSVIEIRKTIKKRIDDKISEMQAFAEKHGLDKDNIEEDVLKKPVKKSLNDKKEERKEEKIPKIKEEEKKEEKKEDKKPELNENKKEENKQEQKDQNVLEQEKREQERLRKEKEKEEERQREINARKLQMIEEEQRKQNEEKAKKEKEEKEKKEKEEKEKKEKEKKDKEERDKKEKEKRDKEENDKKEKEKKEKEENDKKEREKEKEEEKKDEEKKDEEEKNEEKKDENKEKEDEKNENKEKNKDKEKNKEEKSKEKLAKDYGFEILDLSLDDNMQIIGRRLSANIEKSYKKDKALIELLDEKEKKAQKDKKEEEKNKEDNKEKEKQKENKQENKEEKKNEEKDKPKSVAEELGFELIDEVKEKEKQKDNKQENKEKKEEYDTKWFNTLTYDEQIKFLAHRAGDKTGLDTRKEKDLIKAIKEEIKKEKKKKNKEAEKKEKNQKKLKDKKQEPKKEDKKNPEVEKDKKDQKNNKKPEAEKNKQNQPNPNGEQNKEKNKNDQQNPNGEQDKEKKPSLDEMYQKIGDQLNKNINNIIEKEKVLIKELDAKKKSEEQNKEKNKQNQEKNKDKENNDVEIEIKGLGKFVDVEEMLPPLVKDSLKSQRVLKKATEDIKKAREENRKKSKEDEKNRKEENKKKQKELREQKKKESEEKKKLEKERKDKEKAEKAEKAKTQKKYYIPNTEIRISNDIKDYTEQKKKQYVDQLAKKEIKMFANRAEAVDFRSKHSHQVEGSKEGYAWNEDYDKDIAKAVDWIIEYFMVKDSSWAVLREEKRLKIPKHKYTIPNIDTMKSKYEKQGDNNCYCCSGTASYNQFIRNEIANKRKVTDNKEVDQYALREYLPEFANRDIMKNHIANSVGVDPDSNDAEELTNDNYDKYKNEILEYAGKNKDAVGSVFELADFFLAKQKDIAMHRVLFQIPSAEYKQRQNINDVIQLIEYTKDEKKVADHRYNNVKACFLDKVNEVLRTGNTVTIVGNLCGELKHYLTIYGIEGNKLLYMDSLKPNEKNLKADVDEFFLKRNGLGQTIEINWFSKVGDVKQLTGKYRNLNYDKNNGFSLKERTTDEVNNVGHTLGVGASEDVPGVTGVTESIYVPIKYGVPEAQNN